MTAKKAYVVMHNSRPVTIATNRRRAEVTVKREVSRLTYFQNRMRFSDTGKLMIDSPEGHAHFTGWEVAPVSVTEA